MNYSEYNIHKWCRHIFIGRGIQCEFYNTLFLKDNEPNEQERYAKMTYNAKMTMKSTNVKFIAVYANYVIDMSRESFSKISPRITMHPG